MNFYGINQFPEPTESIDPNQFSPYESNGGATVAIAGDDFAVIAADTRLCSGYTIHSRMQNKLFQLSPKTVLGSSGCWSDSIALSSLVKVRMQEYVHTHNRTMSTGAVAQMISILMYNRRFFPYFVSNILAGLTKEGEGIVYSYDPIGHCESSKYHTGGTAGNLLQSVLDNQIGRKNISEDDEDSPDLSVDRAVSVAIDTFITAAERDVYTGDTLIVNIITEDGIDDKEVKLRKD